MKPRLVVLFVGIAIALLVQRFDQAGFFKTLKPHYFKQPISLDEQSSKICKKFTGKGTVGAEDFTIDQSAGIAFLSSTDRFKVLKNIDDPNAGIYLLDLKRLSKEWYVTSQSLLRDILLPFPI